MTKVRKDKNNLLEPSTAVVEEKQGDLFTGMERKLPVCITRVDVAKYFGGMITPGWLANLDCAGKGPKSFKCGKKVVYTTTDFLDWLRSMNKGVAV